MEVHAAHLVSRSEWIRAKNVAENTPCSLFMAVFIFHVKLLEQMIPAHALKHLQLFHSRSTQIRLHFNWDTLLKKFGSYMHKLSSSSSHRGHKLKAALIFHGWRSYSHSYSPIPNHHLPFTSIIASILTSIHLCRLTTYTCQCALCILAWNRFWFHYAPLKKLVPATPLMWAL